MIVGEGPQWESIRASGEHIAGRLIQFPGHIEPDELPTYYAVADLFVHLTLSDHWAQVVGEAMASGLPVVVSEFDYASEMIDSGINGYKVDPRNFKAVVKLCRKLLEDRELASQLGDRGYRTVSNMDVNHVCDAFLQAIRYGTMHG